MSTITIIAPNGARDTGATVEAAVKSAALSAVGGTVYLNGSSTLTLDEHYCLIGAGICTISVGAPPAEEAKAPAA